MASNLLCQSKLDHGEMMGKCNVVKISYNWSLSYTSGKVIRIKVWSAKCPECKELLVPSNWHDRRYATRKTAKDILHRHMMIKHRPGLAGCA